MHRLMCSQVLYLLSQLKKVDEESTNTTLDEEVKERLRFQQLEIERLSTLHEELDKKNSECDLLRKVRMGAATIEKDNL